MSKTFDSLREKSYKKVFLKSVKKDTPHPDDPVMFDLELIKKGKLTKNKRYFKFYNDKCIFFQAKDRTKEMKGVCFFDFDLRVEWLHHSSKEKVFDKLIGMRFLRGSDVVELQCVNEEELKALVPFLSAKLNLLNFHTTYKAIKKIGKGNFASVYLVEKVDTNLPFAVKAFSKEVVYAQENGKESLINEIEIMRAMNHPNIIKLHEVYETDNSLYMVMELLKGGNLVDYLKQHGKFSEPKAAVFLRAILKGIAHAHERGIMHRDLKPENILFRQNEMSEENICIADFGLSTFVNVAEYLFSRCGTPGFVAPEVVNLKDTKQKYNAICDEFSCGVIMHILLFGKSVFPGKTYNEILSQNRACDFNFADPNYSKISNAAKDLLVKLLETKPDKRLTAKDALEHEFLKVKVKQSDGSLDNKYEEADFNNLYLQEKKPSKSINSPLYSPLRGPKEGSGSFTSHMNNEETNTNSVTLVTRQPCLNGYANTLENIGSGINNVPGGGSNNNDDHLNSPEMRPGKPSLMIAKSKFNNDQQVAMSPGLKSALNRSNFDRGKQGSVFKKNNAANEEKKQEEENKEEKE